MKKEKIAILFPWVPIIGLILIYIIRNEYDWVKETKLLDDKFIYFISIVYQGFFTGILLPLIILSMLTN